MLEMVEQAGKKKRTLIYQAASDIWDCAVSTVREDIRNARELGQWVDEMPYKISRQRIRYFRQEAKLRGVDIFVVLDEDAKTIDELLYKFEQMSMKVDILYKLQRQNYIDSHSYTFFENEDAVKKGEKAWEKFLLDCGKEEIRLKEVEK